MNSAYVRKFFSQFFLFTSFVTLSFSAQAGHPSTGGEEMVHPAVPLPENALVPEVSFQIIPDMMDGYNLIISTSNFSAEVPVMGAEAFIQEENGLRMRGHMHLYVNGEKRMRVYGNSVHLPVEWLVSGINSITLSANNHAHGTFLHEGQEIQSTIIIDGDAEELIRNVYSWPKAN